MRKFAFLLIACNQSKKMRYNIEIKMRYCFYVSEPHAAIAWRLLRDQLQEGEYGLFLGTAHPAKFRESVEEILQQTLTLPPELAERAELPLLSHPMQADFAALRAFLLK